MRVQDQPSSGLPPGQTTSERPIYLEQEACQVTQAEAH